MRNRAQSKRDEHDSTPSVVLTHLFSAPLIELKKTDRGSGCVLAEKVDELSYQGERETLLKTLANASKKVKFLSEAANETSFARAVGCASPYSLGGGARGGGGVGGGATFGARRSCRDGECRIMHFTGHGVHKYLTFENEDGKLQYVDQDCLLRMLQGRRSGQAEFGSSRNNSAVDCTVSRGSSLARRSGHLCDSLNPPPAAEANYGAGVGYGPFEDVDVMFTGLGSRGAGEGFVDGRAAPPRSGLQLVFLSSCHSASVADCFIEAVRSLPVDLPVVLTVAGHLIQGGGGGWTAYRVVSCRVNGRAVILSRVQHAIIGLLKS